MRLTDPVRFGRVHSSGETPIMNSQSIRVENDGQAVRYTEHLFYICKREKHTLRVLIHVDGYETQSYGRVERWDGKKWGEVANIKGATLKVGMKIMHHPDFRRASEADKARSFAADRHLLVKLAEEIL